MPRLMPPQALDQLAEWINTSTDEVGIDGVLQQHGNRIPRRTLQRHLALLSMTNAWTSWGSESLPVAIDGCGVL